MLIVGFIFIIGMCVGYLWLAFIEKPVMKRITSHIESKSILNRVESAILMRISPFFGIINKYSNDKTEVILMRKFLYMLAALLVLIGINTYDVEARTDVYATTYNGNSWYVDQDSVKKVGDVLNFTVYTTSGLSYKVTTSDSNYYNADVFYYNNKLVSDNGQSVWKSPGMMAALRVARK